MRAMRQRSLAEKQRACGCERSALADAVRSVVRTPPGIRPMPTGDAKCSRLGRGFSLGPLTRQRLERRADIRDLWVSLEALVDLERRGPGLARLIVVANGMTGLAEVLER